MSDLYDRAIRRRNYFSDLSREIFGAHVLRRRLMNEAGDDDDVNMFDVGGDDTDDAEQTDDEDPNALTPAGADTAGGAGGLTDDLGGDALGDDQPDESDEESDEDDEKDEEKRGKFDSKTVSIDPDDLKNTLDAELLGVLVKYDTDARRSAKESEKLAGAIGVEEECASYLGSLLLTEEKDDSDDTFDVNVFSADLARLVLNYDSLLDVPGIIVTRALQFLREKYGEDIAEQVHDALKTQYDIDIDHDSADDMDDYNVPSAVGADAMSSGMTTLGA